jgi:hypothetical protein
MKSLLVLCACVALFAVSALPTAAASGTGPPPMPSCHPGVGPCQETDHFGQLTFLGGPLPGCTSLAGWAVISTNGNGIQHINVNASQDFWFTSTMVGPTTMVQGTVTLDSHGNPTSFTPDPSLPTISGQLQQWFGESVNNNNFATSGTTNFQGTTSTGVSVSLHFNLHINTTGSSLGIPNLSSMHFDVSCS